ncbi:topoisomerase II-associated protein PAT1-domain-containing protein [Sporodiniella umbellata]|nr:topoisomerase II-associated protein PAT1-domain-containing protein [Sporodiniella umbellata]
MGDSFFGFDTNLPPLSDEELRVLADKNKQDALSNYDHADVYDFATLRDELGAHEEELLEDDQLGDQLIEDGDNNNDITFAEAPIGQNFDFSGNTKRFNAEHKDPSSFTEEDAFFANRRLKDESVGSGSFRNIWASHSGTTTSRQPSMGRSFGEGSPMTSKSIWGNFSSGLSTPDNNGYSPLVGNHNGLSSFPPNRQHTPQQHFSDALSPSNSAGYGQQPLTLEDLEADMQRQHRYREPANGKVMSLAELEATLSNSRPSPQMSPFGYAPPDPMQMLAMKQQQELKEQELSIARELKRRENLRKSQYDGLMNQHDKDVVNRIQLSQLASGDPYADDFYYQVYTSLRQRAGLFTTQINTNERRGGRRDDNMMQRMQQQLQRIVNDAKRRPKQTQVSLEGALGKITSLTVRNPRQVLQVASTHATHTEALDESDMAIMSNRQVLKLTEDMYTIVLEIEQMRRQMPVKAEDNEEEEEAYQQYQEKSADKIEKLWKSLCLAETFLISLLSTAKGKKLIPRVVRLLGNPQNLKLLCTLVTHFVKLQVCRCVIYPGTTVARVEEAQKQSYVTFDDVELFMNATAPPFSAMIADAPFSVVNQLLQILLEKNDVVRIAQTKPGLAFFTMLLSRAELLKQGGSAAQRYPAATQEELTHWQELYSVLFNMLKGRYLSVFPSLYYLVPINPTTSMLQISLAVDDMYVWQFLAAMAVGASMEQQHILVTEVRDRVMENIVLAKSNRLPLEQASHRIANVNLFLHALGLDASQVSVPM